MNPNEVLLPNLNHSTYITSSSSIDTEDISIGKYIEFQSISKFNIYNICGSIHVKLDFRNNILCSIWKLILYCGLVGSVLFLVLLWLYKIVYYNVSYVSALFFIPLLVQVISVFPMLYIATSRLQNEIINIAQKSVIKDVEWGLKLILIISVLCVLFSAGRKLSNFLVLIDPVMLTTWGVFIIY